MDICCDFPDFTQVEKNIFVCSLHPDLKPIIINRNVDLDVLTHELNECGWETDWKIDSGFSKQRHFHTVFELTFIERGFAMVQLGGTNGPVITIRKGDLMLIPPGVQHAGIFQSSNIRTCGAYQKEITLPFGYKWDWKTTESPTQSDLNKFPINEPINPLTGKPFFSILSH